MIGFCLGKFLYICGHFICTAFIHVVFFRYFSHDLNDRMQRDEEVGMLYLISAEILLHFRHIGKTRMTFIRHHRCV